MNTVTIHYCYPTSDMARELGTAGFYVTVGVDTLVISPVFGTIHGAEGFCRNKCLTWAPHGFGQTWADRERARGNVWSSNPKDVPISGQC